MHLANNTFLQGGKYKIVRFINSGGFGCTYEGEHVMLHRQVAIKEFFVKDFCNRDGQTSHVTVGTQSKVQLVSRLKKKFVEEAIVLSQFEHPNIVRVSDVFEENGTAYYVMDYIEGKSLHRMVSERGALTEHESLHYIRQVAEALKYVHSFNRLHLDVKPGNIMVDGNGNTFLIDFGASKQYDEVDGENTSTLLGKTPGYAPIEQMINSVQKFTPATDIYALGATLFKLVVGETPPVITIIIEEGFPELPSGLSKTTKDAICKAMEASKKDRPQTIEEWMKIVKGEEEAVFEEDKEDTVPETEDDQERMPAEALEYSDKGNYKRANPYELKLKACSIRLMKWKHAWNSEKGEKTRRIVAAVATCIAPMEFFMFFSHAGLRFMLYDPQMALPSLILCLLLNILNMVLIFTCPIGKKILTWHNAFLTVGTLITIVNISMACTEHYVKLIPGRGYYRINLLGEKIFEKENKMLSVPLYSGGYSLIDTYGERVVPDTYDYIHIVSDYAVLTKEWKSALASEQGMLTEFKYDEIDIGGLMYNRIPIRVGNKWGFIDHTGKEVIPPQYKKVRPFKMTGGRGCTAEVTDFDGNTLLIDLLGEESTAPKFS